VKEGHRELILLHRYLFGDKS